MTARQNAVEMASVLILVELHSLANNAFVMLDIMENAVGNEIP